MINKFSHKYYFLSNFYPCIISYGGVCYKSVEHAYQAAKTDQITEQELIRNAKTPAIAKKLGQSVSIRSDWNIIKVDIMYSLLKVKFSLSYLQDLLLETGDNELIEGNWWDDTFWGVCNGFGENNLGKLLMRIRNEIQRSTN